MRKQFPASSCHSSVRTRRCSRGRGRPVEHASEQRPKFGLGQLFNRPHHRSEDGALNPGHRRCGEACASCEAPLLPLAQVQSPKQEAPQAVRMARHRSSLRSDDACICDSQQCLQCCLTLLHMPSRPPSSACAIAFLMALDACVQSPACIC